MSDLTFIARAQNNVKWADFSTNHWLSTVLPVVTVTKKEKF